MGADIIAVMPTAIWLDNPQESSDLGITVANIRTVEFGGLRFEPIAYCC